MSPGLPIKTTWNRITQESRDTTQKEAATAPKVAGEVDETAAKLHCVAQVQPDTLHETEPWLKQAASLGSLWCPYGVLWFLHVPHWSFPLRTSVLQGGALWSLLTDMQNQAMPYHCSIYSTVHSLYVTVQYIGIYWLCAHIMHTCAGAYKHSCILVCMHTYTRRYMYIYIFASSWATTFTPMRVARDIYILTLSNSQVVTIASGVDYHWAFWLLHPLVQLAGGFFIQPEFLLFSWLGLSSRNQSSFFLCLTVPALGAIWIWPIRGVNLHVKLLPRKFLYFWNRHTFVAKVAWCLASSRTKENGMVEEVPVNEESGDCLFVLWSS